MPAINETPYGVLSAICEIIPGFTFGVFRLTTSKDSDGWIRQRWEIALATDQLDAAKVACDLLNGYGDVDPPPFDGLSKTRYMVGQVRADKMGGEHCVPLYPPAATTDIEGEVASYLGRKYG